MEKNIKRTISTGSDFSGIGAFDQAFERLGIKQNKKFACDLDKFARQTYILNYGMPEYYPMDVYDRKIPEESLGIYMTSPPCQGFSLSGKRGGSILFLNSHEFIKINNPRYFIFENVKGLLSHDRKDKELKYGNTFNQWVNYLGGKSVNGNPVIFPHEESVPYHIYHFILNAKEHGIPQNRERVFIVGIRDDKDNNFSIPKKVQLKKYLKDVLEKEVDEKYFLSEKAIKGFLKEKPNFSGKFEPMNGSERHAKCITTNAGSRGTDNFLIKANTIKGYEVMTAEDSLNLSVPSSKTRRGRVGKKVAQTLDTACNQGVMIGAIRGRNPENPTSRETGLPTKQMLELNVNGTSNALTTVQKDNVAVFGNSKDGQDPKIRRLTPRECFRFMDFPESFKWDVSDNQAYKQAGNSIPVGLLVLIIKNLLRN